MTEITINENDAGGRLDKYLCRFLKEAPSSFIYKMLRKKNITLNGKKAAGTEKLSAGDAIKLFLSDETVVKFGGRPSGNGGNTERQNISTEIPEEFLKASKLEWKFKEPQIIYENNDILVINKPADVLSQPADGSEPSLNEWILSYVIKNGFSKDDYLTVHPAAANRLDRNTSGVILAGKTLPGLRFLSAMIKEKKLDKYYLTLVQGEVKEKALVTAYLLKSKTHNQVKIFDRETEGASLIKTEYTPVGCANGHTLLLVKLITGKSHQIRAHLAYIHHPVFGDPKYGIKSETELAKRCGLRSQFLHSYMTVFPENTDERFAELSRKKFIATLPENLRHVLERMGLLECLHGIHVD